MSRTNYLRRRAHQTKHLIAEWAIKGCLLVDKREHCAFLVCEKRDALTDCNMLPKHMFKIVKRLIETGALFHSDNENDCKTLFCDSMLPSENFHIESIIEPRWVTVWPLTLKPDIEVAQRV
jgi:hypothetical protein